MEHLGLYDGQGLGLLEVGGLFGGFFGTGGLAEGPEDGFFFANV